MTLTTKRAASGSSRRSSASSGAAFARRARFGSPPAPPRPRRARPARRRCARRALRPPSRRGRSACGRSPPSSSASRPEIDSTTLLIVRPAQAERAPLRRAERAPAHEDGGAPEVVVVERAEVGGEDSRLLEGRGGRADRGPGAREVEHPPPSPMVAYRKSRAPVPLSRGVSEGAALGPARLPIRLPRRPKVEAQVRAERQSRRSACATSRIAPCTRRRSGARIRRSRATRIELHDLPGAGAAPRRSVRLLPLADRRRGRSGRAARLPGREDSDRQGQARH